MTTKAQFTYQVGDRVAERPKTHGLIAIRQEVKDRIAQYRSQRYGTVVDVVTKPLKGKRTIKMLRVQWDHLKTPTEHAQCRICPVEIFPQLMDQTCALLGE
jgi:hypothetical protein